jgi:F420-dependent oxidoreductase-like protein
VTYLGLQLPSFTFAGVPNDRMFERIAETALAAEASGFDSFWVMDHYHQIANIGPVTDPMLEAYTLLSGVAARTSRIFLGAMVTGVTYRNPAFLAKVVTTLDIVSSGRAILGIGAAWNEEESNGLGFPFPPLGERFELLEDTLRFVHDMWQGERGTEKPFEGRHVRATRLLNSPQALSKPHPPILVGGGGERKTLRLVAQYADACNVFGAPPMLQRKFEILRQHCADVGRDPEQIERTTLQNVNLTAETPAQVVDRFGELADAGAQHVIIGVRDVHDISHIERIGREVIPQLKSL